MGLCAARVAGNDIDGRYQFPLTQAVAARTSPQRIVLKKNQLLTTTIGFIQSGLFCIFRRFHKSSFQWQPIVHERCHEIRIEKSDVS